MWNPFGSSADQPHLRVQPEGPVAVVQFLTEEIRDPEVAAEVREELRALVEPGAPGPIVLDLAKVRYISSTGFAVLIGFGKFCKDGGIPLAIASLHPEVRTGASICGLPRVIPTFGGVAEASGHLTAAAGA